VAAVAGDKIRMRLIDGLKPSVIDGNEDGGFLYLLMPVRI
jgi:DNA polymerase III sliding clamp (beta) subunit (PCNA family)